MSPEKWMKIANIKNLLLLFLLMLLASYAYASDVVVSVDMSNAGFELKGELRHAKIVVIDLRKELNLERTTIGGVSMGSINLTPSVTDIVRRVIEAKADAVLVDEVSGGDPQTVYCGIRAFDVTTPATLLYWDINAKIDIILRARKQDRAITILATERTYVWPSEAIIQRVVTDAVTRFGVEAEVALKDLLKNSQQEYAK
jgi:hypothetical protein